MKDLALHFHIRYPNTFNDQDIKNKITIFIQGYIQGRMETVSDEDFESQIMSISKEDITEILKMAFSTELWFKDLNIIRWDIEVFQTSTEFDVTIYLDIDISEKNYRCTVVIPMR